MALATFRRGLIFAGLMLGILVTGWSQQASKARQWNELLLEAIRGDFARPTVHARNLFHVSAAMYDAWAVMDPVAQPYFLGREINGRIIPFEGFPLLRPELSFVAQEEALSFAAYRIIKHRFADSPSADQTLANCDFLMEQFGYNLGNESVDYRSGSAASLGNYIAQQIILHGFQDGSLEYADYGNRYYFSINPPLLLTEPGNPNMVRPDRWQQLAFELFIDQSGNPISGGTPPFLSPEWGNVVPFALTEEDLTLHIRDGVEWKVYHDPGPPPFVEGEDPSLVAEYQWGFALVALWSAHLDPNDGVLWDISPAAIGNIDINDMPRDLPGLRDFYDDLEGGDISPGHTINPHTGLPYEPQIVPRADYARVLAEFWADGPDSETPPGHWFTILNYVNDHPDFQKRFQGEGEVLDALEWDVKAYLALGGAMHDAAIAAWGIKGYYDYVRPISAIRWMADQGQCSDTTLLNYNPRGIPLIPGRIELVTEDDPLAGDSSQHVGKIKLYSWRGPEFIENPDTDYAAVSWILAENWWPYQRPTFVTPPFAGYVSGHSTYSRAAAEVLTLMTGDPFFPGGLGEFLAPEDDFLVFERGPSQDIILQWATYRDASDQTSLSRIWGGIHPPADDIPGRLIGETVGIEAFAFAADHFNGSVGPPTFTEPIEAEISVYPNPVPKWYPVFFSMDRLVEEFTFEVYDLVGKPIYQETTNLGGQPLEWRWFPFNLTGPFLIRFIGDGWEETRIISIL